ncbi:MAG: arsenosugar biosynthesis radical SAM (seleno)protein ArsS [Elusimicrobiota bacterium]
MNAFISMLKKYNVPKNLLCRDKVSTLLVNMGNLCNQACVHCHIGASPEGKNIMSRKVIEDILSCLKNNDIQTLDITGGAPELNPDFKYFVKSVGPLVNEIIVRSNLTVLTEKEKEHLPEFFSENKVHVISSLPCYTKENVDKQRGSGVFKKSIRGLNQLNRCGFGKNKELKLDLVYNPLGAYLPGRQHLLEKDYKNKLYKEFGIVFDDLLTITNVPVNKFKETLESNNQADGYYKLLRNNFNPDNVNKVMCKSCLSVGFDGKLYDCDFNLSIGEPIRNDAGEPVKIKNLEVNMLESKEIITGSHCLACTAGSGSSCQGAFDVEESGKGNAQTENSSLGKRSEKQI